MTVTIAPALFFKFFDPSNTGAPLSGGLLFSYLAGTSTKTPTWTDSTQSVQNANPIVLDSRGECNVWMDPQVSYKFVLSPANDTDPPSSPLKSVDNVTSELTAAMITAAFLGPLLYPRTAGEIAAGVTPTSYVYPPGDVRRYGVLGDGATDDSVAMQNAVNANKGGYVYVVQGLIVLCAGILLSGSTYNNTKILVYGALKLKVSSGSNFGGAWVGLILQSCDNVVLDILDYDGNRANQPQNEHIFCVGVAGASNYKIPRLYAREIRGDALYIGQSTWGSSSTNPTDGRVGQVHVVNSVDDGRNAISIVAAVGLTIDSLYSMKVGGTVNSVLEPGGLDLEPDAGYETISGVVIGTVNVTTSGTGGCQIFGKSITGVDATRDWNISDITMHSVTVQKTGTSGSGLNGNNLFRCKDVRINGSLYFATAVYGAGWVIDFVDRIYGLLKSRTVSNGVTLGFTNSVNDFELECHVTDYSTAGVKTTLVTNGKLRGRVYGAKAASTSFAVQCHNNARGTITQTDVTYSVDAPYDGVNVRAFRNEPANLVTYGAGTVCRDCDWTGYASFTVCFDTSLPKINILGVNYGTAQPANGAWQQGDVVYNSTPSLAAGKVTTGWTRLTTGTANVANTDWAAQVVPNS